VSISDLDYKNVQKNVLKNRMNLNKEIKPKLVTNLASWPRTSYWPFILGINYQSGKHTATARVWQRSSEGNPEGAASILFSTSM